MISPQYWAGLFDGEGMVSLCYCNVRKWKTDQTKSVQTFKFVVGVSNTHLPIIDELHRAFAGDVNASNRSGGSRHKPHHKTVWAWKIAGRERQMAFLSTIQPFAVIKKEQIELGLEYVSTMVDPGQRLSQGAWEKRLSIYTRLRELNRMGFERQIIKPRPIASVRPNPRDIYSPEELATKMNRARNSRHMT